MDPRGLDLNIPFRGDEWCARHIVSFVPQSVPDATFCG